MLLISQLQLGPNKSVTPDIEFQSGSVNVVLGRNHSGKTALCRLLAGLPTPATARVSINGRKQMMGVDRSWPVSMVYQAFVNYPNWNVAENIASPLTAGLSNRLTAAEIDKRVHQLAAKVHIEELLHRMPHELSGGQQQRLAIARALAKEPQVLVMDEPLVNIDYKLREELAGELKFLVADSDTCLVYFTSDARDTLSLGDFTVLLQDGEVLQVGKPVDVYRSPLNFKAADLLSDPGINPLSDNSAVRPEHVSLDPLDGLTFTATISGVETNGAETYLHAEVDIADKSHAWVVKLKGMRNVQSGEQVSFYISEADVLTFKEDEGQGASFG
ncbi:MAG: ABC transporter ATP-binding protein [bacterium]|nr:ABC transporter ATP-binding protein [Gammaproteobacteria bacterium]